MSKNREIIYIARDGERTPTELADLCGHRFEIFDTPRGKDDVGAGPGEGRGDRCSDALPCTGDDCDLIGQEEAVVVDCLFGHRCTIREIPERISTAAGEVFMTTG